MEKRMKFSEGKKFVNNCSTEKNFIKSNKKNNAELENFNTLCERAFEAFS